MQVRLNPVFETRKRDRNGSHDAIAESIRSKNKFEQCGSDNEGRYKAVQVPSSADCRSGESPEERDEEMKKVLKQTRVCSYKERSWMFPHSRGGFDSKLQLLMMKPRRGQGKSVESGRIESIKCTPGRKLGPGARTSAAHALLQPLPY